MGLLGCALARAATAAMSLWIPGVAVGYLGYWRTGHLGRTDHPSTISSGNLVGNGEMEL